MAYLLLRNNCTKNYWNRTTIVEIIVGGWVVSFFETQCKFSGFPPKTIGDHICLGNTTIASLVNIR